MRKGEAYGVELLAFKMFMVIAAIGLGLAVWSYVASNVDNTYFWKNFYAKDLSLTMGAIESVPGDVDLVYKQRSATHEFEFEILPGIVQIYQIPRDAPSRWFYPRARLDEFSSQSFFTTFPIKTQQTAVMFEPQTTPTCVGLQTYDLNYKTKEFLFGSLVNAQTSTAFKVKEATEQQAKLTLGMMTTTVRQRADMFLYFDQQEGNFTTIYYAYNLPKSKKLSCFVSTALQNHGVEAKSLSIIPAQNLAWTQQLTTEPTIIIQIGKQQNTLTYPKYVLEGVVAYYETIQ